MLFPPINQALGEALKEGPLSLYIRVKLGPARAGYAGAGLTGGAVPAPGVARWPPPPGQALD